MGVKNVRLPRFCLNLPPVSPASTMHRLRPYLLSLAICLVLAACGQEEAPLDILTQSEMVPVLKDMQIAYAGVDNTVRNTKQLSKKYEEMNQLVLKKNNVDRERFKRSYDYYKMQPELMDTIFSLVIGALNEEMAALQAGKVPSSKLIRPAEPNGKGILPKPGKQPAPAKP
jgi:hypothetical protein